MADTYTQFLARLKAEAKINTPDTQFDSISAYIIRDAEYRCLRDLDPQVARKYAQSSFMALSSLRPRLGVPADCLIIRALYYFTPAGTTTRRNPIERRTEEFVKDYWPDSSLQDLPKYFCDLGNSQLLVVPTANDAYIVELGYVYRLPSLVVATPADGTQTTYLSTFHPDLLFAAAMVQVAGAKKNYGAMADDPAQAVSWNGMYEKLLPAALMEEGRRKSTSYADESKNQPPEKNAVQ